MPPAVVMLKDMFEGVGPEIVLECVGSKQSMNQALRSLLDHPAVSAVTRSRVTTVVPHHADAKSSSTTSRD